MYSVFHNKILENFDNIEKFNILRMTYENDNVDYDPRRSKGNGHVS